MSSAAAIEEVNIAVLPVSGDYLDALVVLQSLATLISID
jgi:hypothetical protein